MQEEVTRWESHVLFVTFMFLHLELISRVKKSGFLRFAEVHVGRLLLKSAD